MTDDEIRSPPASRRRIHAVRRWLNGTESGWRLLSFLALMAVFAKTSGAAPVDQHFRVLVLHSHRQSLPINTDWYRGIVRGFASAADVRVDIEIEALDLVRYSEDDHIAHLLDVYRLKYAGAAPDLIIPTYTPALELLLEDGEHLFSDAPVVFCGADGLSIDGREIPSHVTGLTSRPEIAGTAELALQLSPDARQLAVIVGSGAMDRDFERRARRELRSVAERIELIWLRGLPLEELLEAVQRLPRDTPILYVLQLEDRTGETQFPFYTTRRLAEVANAPIYGLWDTLIGNGIIGGRLVTIEEDGFRAAQMGLRILRGEPPAAISILVPESNPTIVDGRQLARWRIAEDRLPADAEIRYAQPSFWDAHSGEILTAAAVIAGQALLIVALFTNRRRLRLAQGTLTAECRRREEAEALATRLRGRLARFSKELSLGTMAIAISHEINQPLIAIQNYAQAAKRRLQGNLDDKGKIIELFAKIAEQAERAGAITERIRALVGRSEPQLQIVALPPIVEEVIRLMAPESVRWGCHLSCEASGDLPQVLADSLQVQLVLVNLLRNAMQSACASDGHDKRVTIDLRLAGVPAVQVSVADHGPGVPPERVAEIFEPLYTSSAGGLGMGLAISRSIIEAHGERLWYEPGPTGGAIFRFTLRVAGT
jgi:signal transduction histidine kinase